jgi:hypothetical protein
LCIIIPQCLIINKQQRAVDCYRERVGVSALALPEIAMTAIIIVNTSNFERIILSIPQRQSFGFGNPHYFWSWCPLPNPLVEDCQESPAAIQIKIYNRIVRPTGS